MAEADELTAALQKLAFNMLLADGVAAVPRSAAAYWLVHVRTRKIGRLPRAKSQEMRTAGRLLRMEGAFRQLRLGRGKVEWIDLESRPAFAVEVLRQLPMGNRLLRLTARDSLATTWKLLGDTATVDWLLDVLATERSYRVRARAARALGFIGQRRAVPALVKLLAFERSSVRLEALMALGRIADPSTLPVVADLLERRPYDAVAFHAGRALALFGPSAVPKLAERARESGDRSCIAALGLIGDPSAVPALEELLHRGYPIATHAVMALARLGEPGLVALLNPSTREIRTQALYAISDRNDPRVLAAVGADLRQEQGVTPIVVGNRIPVDATNLEFFLRCARDPTSKVREYAAYTLGRTPRRYLRRAFSSLMRLALDSDRHVQWAAQRSLAELRPTAQLLRRLGSRDRAIRSATMSVLGFIRDPALLDVFRDRLADDGEDIEVRKAAGEALVRSIPWAKLERAIALLHDESTVVRVWAAHGFHQLFWARAGADRDAALAALRSAAKDADAGVRVQVMRSLGHSDSWWWAAPDQREQARAVLRVHLKDSAPEVRGAARETLDELERAERNRDEWLNQRRQPYWTGRDAWTGAIGHMLAACGWDEESEPASERFVYRAVNRAGRRRVTVERLPYAAGGVALDGEIARDGEHECVALRWMETTSPFAARHAISEWTDPFVSPDEMRQNLERLRTS